MEMVCPPQWNTYDRVTLAHGGGGRLMQQMINQIFLPAYNNKWLSAQTDGVVLEFSDIYKKNHEIPVDRLVVSTDAFTVNPIFFPGGNIGSLAVHGTVNDVAMAGARVRYLTSSFIIEEGFLFSDLRNVVKSMAQAAREAGCMVVAGDTKVVEKGRGDGLYISTTGIGCLFENIEGEPPSPSRLKAGDQIIVSGPIGDHGAAVIAAREGIEFGDSPLTSDAASVVDAVEALYREGCQISCLRDPTRGGVASVLNELASACGLTALITQAKVPVKPQVKDVAELLGLDPFYMPSEGRFIVMTSDQSAKHALSILRENGCPEAALMGEFRAGIQHSSARVVLETETGAVRVLDLLAGEQLPRIC